MDEPTPDPEVTAVATPAATPDTPLVAAEEPAATTRQRLFQQPRVLVASVITAVALAGGGGYAVGAAFGHNSSDRDLSPRGRFSPPPGFQGRDGQPPGLPPGQQAPLPAPDDNRDS